MFSKKWVLPIAILVFLVPVAMEQQDLLNFTHGVFSYPFDDTFIHMAIAKNIAIYGNWGISPHLFSSASSSILYPILLAGCFKLFGVWAGFPLVINIVAAIFTILVVQKWLDRQGMKAWDQILSLIAFIFLVPLPAIAIFGMEHTLQILFDFLFIYHFSGYLATTSADHPRLPWHIYFYGALVTATRYEGMFLIGMACFMILLRKFSLHSLFLAFKLGGLSFLPLLVFGIYFMSKGGIFIPNSVLVKSVTPPLSLPGVIHFFTSDIFIRLYFAHPTIGGIAVQRLLILLPLVYLLYIADLQNAPAYRYVVVLLAGMILLHLLFAGTGILFRYESYTVACSIPILALMFYKYTAGWVKQYKSKMAWIVACLLLLLSIPIVIRSREAFGIMLQGSINIYEQQYQMGKFVHQYYDQIPVAMGDIGAISYFSHANNVDLEGLGNLEIAKSRKANYWTPDFLYGICKKDSARIAIVFDVSYSPLLLSRWYKVATWKITKNVACYSDVVSFYAIDSSEGPILLDHLKAFRSQLPSDVVVRYFK